MMENRTLWSPSQCKCVHCGCVFVGARGSNLLAELRMQGYAGFKGQVDAVVHIWSLVNFCLLTFLPCVSNKQHH